MSVQPIPVCHANFPIEPSATPTTIITGMVGSGGRTVGFLPVVATGMKIKAVKHMQAIVVMTEELSSAIRGSTQ